MSNPITWIVAFAIVGLFIVIHVMTALRTRKWVKENPSEAWKRFLNGGF